MISLLAFFCKKCNFGYRVPDADTDLFLINKSFLKCPNKSICGGRIKRMGSSDQLPNFRSKIVTAKELYAATMGIGFSAERVCSPKNLRKLLIGKKIEDIAVDVSTDPQRSFIHSLTIEGGKVFHFGMSTQGATIFKMTEIK